MTIFLTFVAHITVILGAMQSLMQPGTANYKLLTFRLSLQL